MFLQHFDNFASMFGQATDSTFSFLFLNIFHLVLMWVAFRQLFFFPSHRVIVSKEYAFILRPIFFVENTGGAFFIDSKDGNIFPRISFVHRIVLLYDGTNCNNIWERHMEILKYNIWERHMEIMKFFQIYMYCQWKRVIQMIILNYLKF